MEFPGGPEAGGDSADGASFARSIRTESCEPPVTLKIIPQSGFERTSKRRFQMPRSRGRSNLLGSAVTSGGARISGERADRRLHHHPPLQRGGVRPASHRRVAGGSSRRSIVRPRSSSSTTEATTARSTSYGRRFAVTRAPPTALRNLRSPERVSPSCAATPGRRRRWPRGCRSRRAT